jgi:hypothetical protein
MKKLLLALALLVAAYSAYEQHARPARTHEAANDASIESPTANALVVEAFRNRHSNVEVQGSGTIERVLPDDRDGSQHQRFIVEVAPGHTVLIAHNIDLAPRVPALQPGESIEFRGEYEWNERGGVVHWTHHDPGARHAAGWLRYRGQLYQ